MQNFHKVNTNAIPSKLHVNGFSTFTFGMNFMKFHHHPLNQSPPYLHSLSPLAGCCMSVVCTCLYTSVHWRDMYSQAFCMTVHICRIKAVVQHQGLVNPASIQWQASHHHLWSSHIHEVLAQGVDIQGFTSK